MYNISFVQASFNNRLNSCAAVEKVSSDFFLKIQDTVLPLKKLIDIDIYIFITLGTFIYFVDWFLLKIIYRFLLAKDLLYSPSKRRSCKKCRFYSLNAYLICAVHHLNILTSKAADCSDYLSEKS